MDILEYWKKRCELAEAYIDESPCDPDIYEKQLNAWNKWCEFKKLTIPVVVGQSEQLHGVEVLCYFQDMCRVGYWDEEIQRWVIHSDGVKRYYKYIDKHLPIPN